MSMRDYSFDDYGIILKKEDIERIINITSKENGEICDSEVLEENFDYQISFTGEAVGLLDDGTEDWNKYMTFNYETIYYCGLKNASTLIKPAYSSLDEAAEELKDYYGMWFPNDFDFRSNICHITGTYYG